MNTILLLKTVILGIVEGLTEFLPVSSTGHLIVTEKLLGLDGAFWDMFEIVIQLGAILAVCWYFRAKLLDVALHLNRAPQQRFALTIFTALVPALVLGALLHKHIKALLDSPEWASEVVATTAIIGGLLIWWIEKKKPATRIHNMEHVTLKQAFLIGCFQCLAMVPGTSRSGATIMGGLLLKLDRRVATELSFFLAIPTMAAATVISLWDARDELHGANMGLVALGFAVSFLFAILAIRVFLAFVSRHDFIPFAIYRILFGIAMWWWIIASNAAVVRAIECDPTANRTNIGYERSADCPKLKEGIF